MDPQELLGAYNAGARDFCNAIFEPGHRHFTHLGHEIPPHLRVLTQKRQKWRGLSCKLS